MLDSDDAESFFLMALFTNGPAGIVLLVIALAVAYAVSQNEDECANRHCDHGEPVLMENECRCVENAR
jgi:hypothetical protein